MSYQVVLARSAEREFLALPAVVKQRIASALQKLAEQPIGRGARKLSQGPGWRIRVGDYRILYTIDKSSRLITVFAIGHRRDVYR